MSDPLTPLEMQIFAESTAELLRREQPEPDAMTPGQTESEGDDE